MILNGPLPLVAEHGEVADQVEEDSRREHAADQRLEFARAVRREVVGGAGHGAPRHEALAVGGQRADARLQAVGDDQHGVGAEQRGDLGLVGLQLVEGAVERGVLVAGVLQFDDADGQAVEEHDDVGAAVVAVLDDGELVDGEPVVGADVVEVDRAGPCRP